MNRKIILLCTIIALLLFSGIGYGVYKLFIMEDGDDKVIVDPKTSILNVIPTDAIIFLDFRSYSSFEKKFLDKSSKFSHLLNKEDDILRFLNFLPDTVKDGEAVISLHYSTNNTISPLFGIKLPSEINQSNLLNSIIANCASTSKRDYDGVLIHKSLAPGITFAIYGNFLIASTSSVVLEASIRHQKNKTSIFDNDDFNEVFPKKEGHSSLQVNHPNIGKLFSGIVNRGHINNADFFRSFGDWTSMSIDSPSPILLELNGFILNRESVLNYSTVLESQTSKEIDILEMLPFNTNFFYTIPLSNNEIYVEDYVKYLEAHKAIKDYNYLNLIAAKASTDGMPVSDWFFSMNPKEIGIASVPVAGNNEKIFFLKLGDTRLLESYQDNVNHFDRPGYISAFLGEALSPTSEDAFIVLSDWFIVGSTDAITSYKDNYLGGEFFSLDNYLSQTPMVPSYNKEASMFFMINFSRSKLIVEDVIKKDYSDNLNEGFSENNFNFLSLRIWKEKGELEAETSIVIDNLSKLPVLKIETEEGSISKILDDTPVPIPIGPFEIENFTNNKTNYLSQLPSMQIRLLDHNKKSVWTIPFTQPISGYVRQIDKYKNGKLQMVFAAKDKIYILDRLGRWVSNSPINLTKEILLGPEVYDFGKDKNYSFMLLHTDNTVGFYDINGKLLNGWNYITSEEKIKSLPEPFNLDGRRYWIVRTFYQTLIFDRNGIVVADFTGDNRLKPDIEPEKYSSKEVLVTAENGNQLILNLETGDFKKKK